MKSIHETYPSRQRGQTLVEFVLVIPLVLMFCFMVFDVGRAVYYSSVLRNAAREGARYGAAITNSGLDSTKIANIETAVRKHVYGINSAAITITAVDTGTATNTIQVNVSYDFIPATPLVAGLLPGNFLTLTSQATMRIER